jgi:Domain of unknown function (DUF4157)
MSAAKGRGFEQSKKLLADTFGGKTPHAQPHHSYDAAIEMQRAAGNQAVSSLLGHGSGRPLDPATREEMESKFAEDFSDVRVHTGRAAAVTAVASGARAYTKGVDIVFGPGFYSPGTSAGRQLLAHELAHVVQQTRHSSGHTPSHVSEAEAREAGTSVAGAKSASVATSAPATAQCDGMTEEEKRRKQAELMLPTGLVQSLQQQGVIPPEQPPAPPQKLETVDIMAPGLGQYLRQAGIRPPAAPGPTPKPKLPARAAPLSEPEPEEKETVEDLEARLFNPLNPSAKENLMKMIEALGGPSLDINKLTYDELRWKYDLLKNPGSFGPPVEQNPAIGPEKPGGIPLAEIERQKRLQWENLDRYEHEPGSWMATGAIVTGKSPDEVSASLNAAESATGLAVAAGAIGDRRGLNQSPSNAPAPQPEIDPAPKPPLASAERVSPEVDQQVEQGIIEETTATSRPTPRPRPARATTRGRAADAREAFGAVRGKYADQLTVGAGGQVHHAVELQVLDKYPGVYTAQELNDISNMRGIPPENEGLRQLHNSKIREILDRHYRALDSEIAERQLSPGSPEYNQVVRKWLTDATGETDWALGQFFSENRPGTQ